MYDKEQTMEKTKFGFIPKIDIKMWNERFSDFEAKILQSNCRNEFVELVCKTLARREPKMETIEFFTKLSGVDDNPRILETLRILT